MQICSARRTLPHQESSTWTALPVSPDKAAALLLLARNECVGVRSLLTTLLSHGLSCRRRAKRHHISKMLETFFPGPRGVPYHTYQFHTPGLWERPGSPGRTAGHKSEKQKPCPRVAATPQKCFHKAVPLRLSLQYPLKEFLVADFANHSPLVVNRSQNRNIIQLHLFWHVWTIPG